MKIIMAYHGESLLIDDDDFDRLNQFKWSLNDKGYAQNRIHGSSIYMHQAVIGYAPKGMMIHHKDENKLNNQKSNLEFVRRGTHKHHHTKTKATSGVRGVSMHGSKFQARIYEHGSEIYIGTFDSWEKAAHAYDKKARELHGDNAVLNFP
jgi:urocanate hydratase